MNTTQKIVRYGATLALALALVGTTAPVSVFATDEEAAEEGSDQAYEQAYDPSAAPFVLETVSGGVQTAAAGAGFGLGIGAAASGEEGLAIGAAATDLGSQAAAAGIGIPQLIVGQP
jgi:hypothetical protein